MNKPTKGELHEQINRLKTQEKVLRKALSDRELKIGELRSRIESDKIAFDTRCAREKQIAYEHEVAAVAYAKDCHELKQELEQRLEQFKNLRGELETMQDMCKGLADRNSKLRDMMISKAGQYRDATVELHGYKEQSSRYTESIEKLESQVRIFKKFSELKTKQIEKLKKYKEFFHMLKELQGVDISITNKNKED